MTIAEILSDFINKSEFEKFPNAVVNKAKLCLLDWIGCAIAGYDNEVSKKLVDIAIENKSESESTIIGYNQKVSALWAAFSNGAISHAVEMDDGHKWSISHPGVTVIPSALAIGEKLFSSGEELLTSIVVGYEISMRVGEAVGVEHYEIWHTTSTCGTFGATAASSKLLNLSVNQIADGLGNAGSQAAGIWQFVEEGAMTKLLHTAKVGFNGILASLSAEKGFTGAHKIFEGDKGFLKAVSVNPIPEKLIENLGEKYKILESNFKVHSSCGHTHSPIDAVIKAKKQYKIIPENIKEIKINTYSIANRLTGNFNPKNVFEAKFSMPYCIAIALLFGEVDENKFTENILFDNVVRSLMSRISIIVDLELEKKFPVCRPVIVEIETNDNVYSVENYYRKGDPENPLTKKEVEEKFRKLVENILPKGKIDKIINMVMNIEDIQDISILTRELGEF